MKQMQIINIKKEELIKILKPAIEQKLKKNELEITRVDYNTDMKKACWWCKSFLDFESISICVLKDVLNNYDENNDVAFLASGH